ncbi:MAG: hypothetical protein HFJ75_09965 [Eggerthellaceae bacterium]|nr:hypothetical protein [Eggerthellaceae bacterium]
MGTSELLIIAWNLCIAILGFALIMLAVYLVARKAVRDELRSMCDTADPLGKKE